MHASLRPLLALGLAGGCLISDPAPTGIALLRISELPGACVVERNPNGEIDIPTDLPYRRARATASFRASERFPGGHHIALGYQDYDGFTGLLQMEVPPERGYGIAEYPTMNYVQATGFAEWQGGAVQFVATGIGGYLNYFMDEQGERLPGKIYALIALDGRNAQDAEVCRIVAIHASAERERMDAYDPSWLVPRPGLMITAEADKTLTPPALDDLSPPGMALVQPGEMPDPGDAPPRMDRNLPNAFATGGGGSSPCD
ncbi:MAG TPA: hypothetical protein VM513_00185 [Kofleriaceae bacterium]|nr:hypothetical protein [Kofleriaceae bacterium]